MPLDGLEIRNIVEKSSTLSLAYASKEDTYTCYSLITVAIIVLIAVAIIFLITVVILAYVSIGIFH